MIHVSASEKKCFEDQAIANLTSAQQRNTENCFQALGESHRIARLMEKKTVLL